MPKLEKGWTISDFYKVIWNDESKLNLFGSDGRAYVRRRVDEDFLPECVGQTVKFGGGNVIMWGCITCDGVGPLVKVKGRMNSDNYIKLFSDTLLHQWGLNCFIILLLVISLKILIVPNFWPVLYMHAQYYYYYQINNN